MQYYKLKRDKTTGQEIWTIKEGLLNDGNVPPTAHEEILPVLVEIQRNHVMLTIPAVVEKNTAFVSEDALKNAIDKYFVNLNSKNRSSNDIKIQNRNKIKGLKRASGFVTWFLGTYASQVNPKGFKACINCKNSDHVGGYCDFYKAAVIQIEVCETWESMPKNKAKDDYIDDLIEKFNGYGWIAVRHPRMKKIMVNGLYKSEEAAVKEMKEAIASKSKQNRALRGIEYAERPVPAVVKTLGIAEVKKWVKELGIGKVTQVKISNKEKWLKKIYEKLVEIEGSVKMGKQATVTIEEKSGLRAGNKFLPLETSTKKRVINVDEKTRKTVKIGSEKIKAKDLVNLAAKVRYFIDDPVMIKRIEDYKRQRLREGKKLHSGRGQKRMSGQRANRADEEGGSIAYPVPKSTTNIEGALGIVGGMSNPNFVGGFIKAEEKFIEELIFLKNQQLGGSSLDFKEASMKLVNGNDLHLFCGQDQHATTRIDIRKLYPYKMKAHQKEIKPSVGDKPGVIVKCTKEDRDAAKMAWKQEQERLRALGKRVPDKPPARYSMQSTSATKHVLVQNFLADAIASGEKYDLIIIDPPYNASYDAKYGTNQFNNIGESNKFLAWLVDACTQILNQDGILISKNWRNIRPLDSDFVAGIITMSGGFRRAVIMEAWQFQPSSPIEFDWEYYQSESVYDKKVRPVSWILGIPGKWTKNETKLMKNYVNIDSTKNGVVITDPMGPSKSATVKIGNCINMSIEEFLVDHQKRDVVILDECKSLGGAVPKTALLKDHLADIFDLDHSKDMKIKGMTELEEMEEGEEEGEESEEGEGENEAKIAWQSEIYNHAVEVLSKNGLVFTKTYFNPVLEKKGLQLLENHVICYEKFETISLFYIYGKP